MTRQRVRLYRVAEPRQSSATSNLHAHARDNDVNAEQCSGPRLGRPSHREMAQTLFEHRRDRQRWFGEHAKALQDSAWDILLELFLCHEDGRVPSTTSVAYGAGVPITTALRSLRKLEANGLIDSHTDQCDTRVRRIVMSQSALLTMRGYLDGL